MTFCFVWKWTVSCCVRKKNWVSICHRWSVMNFIMCEKRSREAPLCWYAKYGQCLRRGGAMKALCRVWVIILTEGTSRKKKPAIFVWNKPKKIGAHPPFSFSLHTQWVSGCNSLPTPPSPQRALILCIAASPRCLWFQELNYSATFVDVVLQVNAAELCSSWNCSSSLTAEGRNPPSSAMLLQSLILLIDTAFHKHIFYVDASRREGVLKKTSKDEIWYEGTVNLCKKKSFASFENETEGKQISKWKLKYIHVFIY